MLAPYSTVTLPEYNRPDRATRKFNAFVDNLVKSLGLKLGLEEKGYRDIYEDTEKEISLKKSELNTFQYSNESESESEFFDKKYVLYFFILAVIIFLLTRFKK